MHWCRCNVPYFGAGAGPFKDSLYASDTGEQQLIYSENALLTICCIAIESVVSIW
jgi:hypothetical protein